MRGVIGNTTLTFNQNFNGQVGGKSSKLGTIEVEARTIDGLSESFGYPELVFIDVEGFECEVPKGASKTLKGAAEFFVEVHGGIGLEEFGGSVDALLEYFPKAQFDHFFAPEENCGFSRLDKSGIPHGSWWFLIALNRNASPRDSDVRASPPA